MSRRARRIFLLSGIMFAVLVVASVIQIRTVAHRLAATASRNSAPPMTQSASRPWDGTRVLISGAKIRFVGLCDNTDDPKWWKLDGTPMDKAPTADAGKIEGNSVLRLGAAPPNLQVCYFSERPKGRGWGGFPTVEVEGSSGGAIIMSDGGLASDGQKHVFIDIQRLAFTVVDGPSITIRGEWNDKPFETFAIATPGQTTAGPLAVEFSKEADGTASVKFTGDWQYPAEIVAIQNDGFQARNRGGFLTSGALGGVVSSNFECTPEQIKEVHFRLRGLHRYVITGVAPKPGVRTAPMISEDDLPASLGGKGPVWSGALPGEKPTPADFRNATTSP